MEENAEQLRMRMNFLDLELTAVPICIGMVSSSQMLAELKNTTDWLL